MDEERGAYYINRISAILAIIAVVIAFVEGIFFYASYADPLYRVFMMTENVIGAFIFKASISLKDAFTFYTENPSTWLMIITYIYGLVIFIAPYCTVIWAYNVLDTVFHFATSILRNPFNREITDVLVFAYNDFVKELIKDADRKKYRFRVITLESLSAKDAYHLRRYGGMIYQYDICKIKDKNINYFLKKAKIDDTKCIIIAADSSERNLSVMQMLYDYYGDGEKGIGVEVYCRCEDESITKLISDDYDYRYNRIRNEREEQENKFLMFDLNLFNTAELQIRDVFKNTPLYSYYSSSESEISSENWDVRMLIAGFGNVGQQVLIQTVEQGVTGVKNRIEIDVIDSCIEEKAGVFVEKLSQHSVEVKERTRDNNDPLVPVLELTVKDGIDDGKLLIRFYSVNVYDVSFKNIIIKRKNECKTGPVYTYAIVAINDAQKGLFCSQLLWNEIDNPYVPIRFRVDDDKQLAKYFKADEKKYIAYPNMGIIPRIDEVINMDSLVEKSFNKEAEEFDRYYWNLVKETNEKDEPNKSIKNFKYYKKTSAKAIAQHYENTYRHLLEKRFEKDKSQAERLIECIFSIKAKEEDKGKDKDDGGFFFEPKRLGSKLITEEWADLEKCSEDLKVLYQMAAAEHRRWNYHMIINGFAPADGKSGLKKGKLSDPGRRIHKCLVKYDRLIQEEGLKDTAVYDLMPVLKYYSDYKRPKKKGESIDSVAF